MHSVCIGKLANRDEKPFRMRHYAFPMHREKLIHCAYRGIYRSVEMQGVNYNLYLKPERIVKLRAICIDKKLCENGAEGEPNFSMAIKMLIDQAQVPQELITKTKASANTDNGLMEYEIT